MDVAGEGGSERVLGDRERLGPVVAAGDGFWYVREGDDEPAILVSGKFARVRVEHGSALVRRHTTIAPFGATPQRPLRRSAAGSRG